MTREGMIDPLTKYSLILLLISLPLVGYGSHLQKDSPNFASYQQHQIDRIEASSHGRDLGPGLGLGLVMTSAWPFTVLVQVILIVMFIATLIIVGTITSCTKRRPIAWAVFAACFSFWVSVILMISRSAIENMRWSFTFLSVAEMITVVGLAIGNIGLLRELNGKLLLTRHGRSGVSI